MKSGVSQIGRRKRAVIVDDSRTMQAALEQVLSLRLGIDIVGVAGDVETAISMIANTQPDLVTIDLVMPYIGGKELLEQLVDFPAMHKVVVSSHACTNLHVIATLEQLGADVCLDKAELSRDPAQFCKKIRSVLAQPKRVVKLGGTSVDTARVSLTGVPKFPIPHDERARLRLLDTLELANDDEDAQLDRLTTHLGRTAGFSTCLLTFIDRDKQWVKSAHGFPRGFMERAVAFCNYTLCNDSAFVVPDAALDNRFSSNPIVVDGPRIRTYVGHPITTQSGVRLGAICLLDCRPRPVTPATILNLRGICEIAGSILDARTSQLQKVA